MAEPSPTREPAGQVEGLLPVLGRVARRPESEAGFGEVVGWLRQRFDVEIALVGPGGEVTVATSDFPASVLSQVEPTLVRMTGGELASVATRAGGFNVSLEAFGTTSPRSVLMVVGARTPGRDAVAVASHTGSLLAALHRAREADRFVAAYQHKAHQVRLALFMALMAADVTLARRIAAGAVPPLLGAGRIRVGLLRCPPADRDRIAQASADESGFHGEGLLVRCPVYDEHLIGVTGESDDVPADAPRRGLFRLLRDLVADHPGYALGVSGPHALHRTAQAYEHARHALVVARATAGRVAVFQGMPSLEPYLPQEAAHRWARCLLQPLESVPRLTVDITRLALQFPRSRVGNLLGVHRNTVAAHLRQAQRALDMDLNDTGSRAVLDLALRIRGSAAGSPDPHAAPADRAELRSLARTLCEAAVPSSTEWAAGFLEPVRGHRDGAALLDTLAAWVEDGTDAQSTARRLGVSRNTVSSRLRTAQRLLSRDLVTAPSGLHDLVHALHLTRRIPKPALLR
ncbi:helix-turn-helix domain-containing protein [Streptomyces sp. B6B3]|uniref:helix-turn-helix domain-containing protein n=1 Tax=Streptomyces sp. B6B3 TaxID=3153570 RepID=UPI00325DDEEB